MEISDIKMLELKSNHRSVLFPVLTFKVRMMWNDYHAQKGMNCLDYADLRRKKS